MTASSVAENVAAVRARIGDAATRAGRRPEDVLLVAVSKTQPAEALREAYAAGLRDFGENYVQELVQKADALRELRELRFHAIGHVQRNKTKFLARLAAAVHSVDSPDLARELGRRLSAGEGTRPPTAFGDDPRLPVLVEVNIASEPQKSGVAPDAVEPVLESIEREPELRLVGLMCVPPFGDDPRSSIPHFEALASLRDRHGGAARLPELSMGMTADFEHAIAAGATVVRVGTAIFGARPKKSEHVG
jgi:pyridoxal phosphate enzyme (YggS family)